MIRLAARSAAAVVVICTAFAVWSTPVRGQGQTPAGTPAAAPQAGQGAPYQPPVMRFDGQGLLLLDALSLTLQHDPNIKLRTTAAEGQQGALRTQTGAFDTTLRMSGSFSREQSKLTESVQLDEVERRNKLRSALTEVTALSESLLAAGNLLRDRNLAYSNPGAWNLSGIKDQAVLNQMTILQAELQLYRDLLASPSLTDQAVRNSLINLRDQTLGKNIDAFNAQQLAIGNAPAQLRSQIDNLGPAPTEEWRKDSQVTMDLTKLFRTGMQVRPYADLTYGQQNYVGKSQYDLEFGGKGIEPVSRGEIGFEVTLPFLRDAGRTAVAAAETAARYDVDASRMAVLFQQSESVLATIQAYWQVRSATDQVEVLRRAVEVQGQLGTITRAMIAANEKPRSEEARVQASTAEFRARYEAAQRQLNDARIALAQAMGIALEDGLSLPRAAEAFPTPDEALQGPVTAPDAFVQAAVARRFDRQAALKAVASGKALYDGARRNTRPVLDITATGWGTSVTQSKLSYGNWVFRSGSAGLNYQQWFANNVARGARDQRQAAYAQVQIDQTNLDRLIALRITQLTEALRIAAGRLRTSAEAVRFYEETVTAEQVRFRTGDSSLVDTLLTEQQAANARIALITAQRDYASLLASLLHESGLLVQDGRVEASRLAAVPPALVGR